MLHVFPRWRYFQRVRHSHGHLRFIQLNHSQFLESFDSVRYSSSLWRNHHFASLRGQRSKWSWVASCSLALGLFFFIDSDYRLFGLDLFNLLLTLRSFLGWVTWLPLMDLLSICDNLLTLLLEYFDSLSVGEIQFRNLLRLWLFFLLLSKCFENNAISEGNATHNGAFIWHQTTIISVNISHGLTQGHCILKPLVNHLLACFIPLHIESTSFKDTLRTVLTKINGWGLVFNHLRHALHLVNNLEYLVEQTCQF